MKVCKEKRGGGDGHTEYDGTSQVESRVECRRICAELNKTATAAVTSNFLRHLLQHQIFRQNSRPNTILGFTIALYNCKSADEGEGRDPVGLVLQSLALLVFTGLVVNDSYVDQSVCPAAVISHVHANHALSNSPSSHIPHAMPLLSSLSVLDYLFIVTAVNDTLL